MTKRIYFQTEETKTVKKKGYIEIDDSYTQVYDCLAKLSFKMKSISESQILFFFFTKATENGVILTDERIFKEYLAFSKANGGVEISRVTFTTAIKNLTDAQILVKLSRGQYQLNPFILWKSSKDDRIDNIESIMKITDKSEQSKYLIPNKLLK